MDIKTQTFLMQSRLIHLGYGTTTDFLDQHEEIKPYLLDRLICYALERVDPDLRELIITKGYRVLVERLKGDNSESIADSTYQVTFISKSGLGISVDGIFLNSNYRPSLDHGVSLAENQ